MTAFAKSGDVVKALRRPLTSAESPYVAGVIAEAQDLVCAFIRRDEDYWETAEDVPGAVRRTVARMAARVFQQAGQQVGVTQQQQAAGPFSTGLSYGSGANAGSPWLAAADKTRLKPYRKGGGLTSTSVNSERGYDRLS